MGDEIFFEVGARIAALRGALKQSEFAERLGVNRQTVSRWEAGERLPDGSSLLRMREAFGADINVILTGQAGGAVPSLPPDEEALLANYRQANSDGRERMRQISATAANSPRRASKEALPGSVTYSQLNTGAGAIQVGTAGGNVNIGKTKGS